MREKALILERAIQNGKFDPRRLQLTLEKAIELRSLYPTQIGQFLQFLQTFQT